MGIKKKRIDKHLLIGRDPGLGKTLFKTGTIKTKKDKIKNRNTKLGKKEKRKQTEH